MPYLDPDDVIEASRQERLRELRKSAPVKAPLPDPLKSASVLMKAVDDTLAGHPAVTSDPDLYRLAYRAFENLFELHRALEGRARD